MVRQWEQPQLGFYLVCNYCCSDSLVCSAQSVALTGRSPVRETKWSPSQVLGTQWVLRPLSGAGHTVGTQ